MVELQTTKDDKQKSPTELENEDKFISGLHELQGLERQLSSTADFFESSYIQADSKKAASGVLERTQDFAVKSLINTVDRLNILARELDKLISQQAGDMTTLNTRIKSIQQRASGCQLHVQQEALKLQRPSKPFVHMQKRIVVPDREVDAAVSAARIGPLLLRESFDSSAGMLLHGSPFTPALMGPRPSPRKVSLSGSQVSLSHSFDGRSSGSPHIYPSGPSAFDSPTYRQQPTTPSGVARRSPLNGMTPDSKGGATLVQPSPLPLTPSERRSSLSDGSPSARSSARRFFSGPIKSASQRDATPVRTVETISEEKLNNQVKGRRWWNVLGRLGRSPKPSLERPTVQ